MEGSGLYLPSRVEPSGDLLNELMSYPINFAANQDMPEDFAQKVSMLHDFTTYNPDLRPVYDNYSTISAFGRHLDNALCEKCINDKQKLEKANGKLSLRDFTDSIWEVYLRNQGIYHLHVSGGK